MTTPAITISQLTKSFAGAPPVLNDFNLTIEQGSFVCLLGVSGCGKSTLLNIIAGLEQPTSGNVEVPSGRAAVMFQDPSLMPWLTAQQNIELALELRGVAKAARTARAQELLELVNLGHAANRLPHELSGGMRQRVALGRALAQDRHVLLMDEPFAALDAMTRDLLHDELERIWQETGQTIVFVTHNVREATRLGDRVLLMSSHRGTPPREWDIEFARPRRIEAPQVSAKALEITNALRGELMGGAA